MAAPADTTIDDDDVAGQARCEVLAALCLAASATVLLFGISQALATTLADDGALGGPSSWELVEMAASGSVFFPVLASGAAGHGMLVLAYVLVLVVSPGAWVGSIGTRVLQAMVAVSSLLVIAGAITIARLVRQPGQIESIYTGPPSFDGTGGDAPDAVVSIVDRGGTALPVVVGVALAAFVGWSVYCALVDLPAATPAAADEETETEASLD